MWWRRCKFLKDSRTQRVCVKKEWPEQKDITSGIPQGSIFTPLLFLICINDLLLFIIEFDKLLYADDTNIAAVGDNMEDIKNNHCTDVRHTSTFQKAAR